MRKHLFFILTTGILPAVAHSHDSFSKTIPVNAPLGEAERDNEKLELLTTRSRRIGVSPTKIAALQSVVYDKYRWQKSDISVCFWNGSQEQQDDIMKLAKVWEDVAPSIKFIYKVNGINRICQLQDLRDSDTMSDIRINLDASDPRPLWNDFEDKFGDWSYVGSQVYQNGAFPTTMNLVGAVRAKKDNKISGYKFNVRHEFGHALALMHEHQRSICRGWFAFKAIALDTGWSEDQVKAQVDSLPNSSNYKFIGAYSPDSIMQYNFKSSWYMPDRPGAKNPCRRRDEVTNLSELDKIAIAYLYDPALNESAERQSYIALHKVTVSQNDQTPAAPDESKDDVKQVAASINQFSQKIRTPERISIQVYPHEKDKDLVLRAVANLGYPLVDQSGHTIRSVSSNVTKFLMKDPTTTVFYTQDVSDFDARFVAWSLIQQGVAIKSIQKYYPAPQNGNRERRNLIQIGASINARGLRVLTEDQIMTAPLPMYGSKE